MAVSIVATGLWLVLSPSVRAATGTLADINHVVLFMQENRAFDHYFGTMAGVRGFKDPNVQVNPASFPSVFYQDVDSSLSTSTNYLLPWYLNYLGGDYYQATQCMTAGSNGYSNNHLSLNKDLNSKWALNNTPWSWGHFTRNELPIHFSIAETWTVGDSYQESVIASTNPNRVAWISGSINVPGGPQTPSQGGVYIDNNESPGCEGTNLNCYPLNWTTAPEFYEAANVTWQVYQDKDNFDDNPLAWFKQFQSASSSSSLYKRGLSYVGLDKFYSDCAAGTLPAVSYIVGPAELSEHPPYQPKDGAYLQRQVVNALVNSTSYKDTVLIVSYDETGGWGDHVTPFHSPNGTAGEWLNDPYGQFGQVYSGPGFRVPFYIVSPWTRGGNVFVDHADHTSQIKFVEKWLAAKGKNVTSTQIPAWRRQYMSDLTQAFDFSSPDTSIPIIPAAQTPSTNSQGSYNGYATCEATYPTTRPPVPYGKQNASTALVAEQGYKAVRGQLTEGRYLTLEMNGYALANSGSSKISASATTATHQTKAQRFVVHQLKPGVDQFNLTSAVDGTYIASGETLTSSMSAAQPFVFNDLGNGKGYTVQNMKTALYLAITTQGVVQETSTAAGFKLFSVTYND